MEKLISVTLSIPSVTSWLYEVLSAKANLVIPVDGGGSCWPGQVQEGGETCCGSGTPALFFRFFPYIEVFLRYF